MTTLVVIAVVANLLLTAVLAAPALPRAVAALRGVAPGAPAPLTPAERAEADVLPPDLEALALAESEPWARDDMRAVLRDRFLERRSWDRVRADVYSPSAN